MENKNAGQLIDKYNKGEATPEEIRLVESWYLKMETGETLNAAELQHEHDLGLRQLDAYLTRRRNILLVWTAAAAVVLLTLFTALFFYNSPKGIKEQISLAQDIPPGKNTAVVTLANGDTLRLSDAQQMLSVNSQALVYEDGKVARQTAAGTSAQLTASTSRGGMYKFKLSDGTLVVLNAESSLKFAQIFEGTQRVVELTGEAYFEVAKNRNMPFIVKTAKQNVEVLGTHFNINSYSGTTSTTLLEGSVKVSAGVEEEMLIPGQQADLTGDKLMVKKADVEAAVSWKDGYFRFNEESIPEIMQKISRWYDVDISYEGEISREVFTGAISRFSNISDVLDMLERTKIVHFKLEGRRVTVLN
ncbi:transmembrane sensor [Pedobacter africanus]|uniref:Uncharacterized protein n=1 Tax=Pedobacter africanus TaxID=151894 RepID=A0ACC6KZ72_9SPHI|nr:FecR domain-containing protein [Pedobacter africanus]MDR6784660.1 hypothetical protein [Pedobacter africanus]